MVKYNMWAVIGLIKSDQTRINTYYLVLENMSVY